MTSTNNISFVFDILKLNGGLREPFTMNELKKAYKHTILKHHPDKGGNVESFKKIDGVFKQITGRNNVGNTKFYLADIKRILQPSPIYHTSPRRPSPRVYTPHPPTPPPKRNSFISRLSTDDQILLVRLLMLLPLFIYKGGRWVIRKIRKPQPVTASTQKNANVKKTKGKETGENPK